MNRKEMRDLIRSDLNRLIVDNKRMGGGKMLFYMAII